MRIADTACQFFFVNDCTQFSSNAFEEFGLTEIFALIQQPSNDTYSFRIYKNDDCTGLCRITLTAASARFLTATSAC